MLSILIPVYNQKVVSLVSKLKKQCEKANIQYQILVFDDASKEKYREANTPLHNEFGVNYLEMSENMGRAKIRNRLGRTAMYDKLLFMDGDSGMVKANFIKNYMEASINADVVYGGREYQKKKPKNDDLALHWIYGVEREALSAKQRNKNPYLNFQSNNFLIDNALFNELRFDEEVKGYGYEDLLFAERLNKKGAKILHIDNEIRHKGLEKNNVFMDKTKNAVLNLSKLNKKGHLMDTRLTAFYAKMKRYGFLSVLLKYFKMNEESIMKNLASPKPGMRNFSLWKLYLYEEYMKEEN